MKWLFERIIGGIFTNPMLFVTIAWILNILFWLGVIYVAFHFISKILVMIVLYVYLIGCLVSFLLSLIFIGTRNMSRVFLATVSSVAYVAIFIWFIIIVTAIGVADVIHNRKKKKE
jgi:hypothetical protein